MANVFQTAAVNAFRETLESFIQNAPRSGWTLGDLEARVEEFEGRLSAASNAFDACTTADKLETVLTTQRAERALAEFVRAWNARKDLDYAKERYWATFNPPQPPRLF